MLNKEETFLTAHCDAIDNAVYALCNAKRITEDLITDLVEAFTGKRDASAIKANEIEETLHFYAEEINAARDGKVLHWRMDYIGPIADELCSKINNACYPFETDDTICYKSTDRCTHCQIATGSICKECPRCGGPLHKRDGDVTAYRCESCGDTFTAEETEYTPDGHFVFLDIEESQAKRWQALLDAKPETGKAIIESMDLAGHTMATYSAAFDDGYMFDLHVCAGSENFYLNSVLFNQAGGEVACMNDAEELLGEYSFDVSGSKYVVVARAF